MKWLKEFTIDETKLPKYKAFEQPFNTVVPTDLMELLLNNKTIKQEHKQPLQNLYDSLHCKSKSRPVGILKTTYSPRYDIGRWFPNGTGLISLKREIKHTIFKHMGWLDIDLQKCQPSIVLSLAKGKLDLTYIQEWFHRPEEVKSNLKEFYSNPRFPLDDKDIKELVNMGLYGGGLKTWIDELRENGKIVKTEQQHKWITGYLNDCRTVRDTIFYTNQPLIEKVKGDLIEEEDIKKRVCSYFLGTIENDILHSSYKWLIKKGYLDHDQCLLEYDGLCFKLIGDYTVDKSLLTKELTEHLVKSTGLKYLKIVFKDYDNTIPHDLNAFESKFGSTFEAMKEEFEKTHAKIINQKIFIKEQPDGFITMSRDHIRFAYEHIKYEELVKGTIVEKQFIDKWLGECTRNYEDIGCYPDPNCRPSDCYNTWTDFRAEDNCDEYLDELDYPHDIRYNKKAFKDDWLGLIKVLCKNNQEVYEYILKWIGYMIQYPAKKIGTMPVFISKEGAGKGTLLKLIIKMLGPKKVLDTACPSRDVWGQFNGLMANCYLVILNELSAKETSGADGMIKTLLTEPSMTINNKGQNSYVINSYHKWITFTNNDCPVATSKDDRRKLIIQCSNEKINDKEYFSQLNKQLDDPIIIRTAFDYFKGRIDIDGEISLKDLNNFDTAPLPRTEYHKDQIEAKKSPVEKFVSYMTYKHQESKRYGAGELYKTFQDWREVNGEEYGMNSSAFGAKIKIVITDIAENAWAVSRTRKGMEYIIDWQIIRERSGIESNDLDLQV